MPPQQQSDKLVMRGPLTWSPNTRAVDYYSLAAAGGHLPMPAVITECAPSMGAGATARARRPDQGHRRRTCEPPIRRADSLHPAAAHLEVAQDGSSPSSAAPLRVAGGDHYREGLTPRA